MSLLAAKVAAAAVLGLTQSAARMPSREMGVWNQIRPGIVTLYAGGKAVGVAALLDDAGYFVAHRSSVVGMPILGSTSDGKQLSFSFVSEDRATSLVLLKTNTWEPGTFRPFRAPTAGEQETGELIAVLPTGPMRMTYGSKHKLGVLNPSRRMVPLTEMRFEMIPRIVGGALIFSESGELIGSLNATLGHGEENRLRNVNVLASGGGGVGGAASNTTATSNSNQQVGQMADNNRPQYSNTGPADLTVAYAVSTDFVRHVLDGFLSPNHCAEFAILGVFCTDAVGGGAQIQQVTEGLPADKAGLKPGDVLINIASNPIQDQLAFASVMLQQKAGKKIPVMIQRGGKRLVVDVTPAKSAD